MSAGLMTRKRGRLAAAPHLDHFAENRQRDLGRRLGADIEADGRVHSLDQLLTDLILIAKSLKTSLDTPPTADHANIFRLTREDHAQAGFIIGVSPGDQH